MKAKVRIDDVFMITGRGVVASCKILEGTVNTGDKILLGEDEHTITGVEMFTAATGSKSEYNVGLVLRSSDGNIPEFKEKVLKHVDTETEIK